MIENYSIHFYYKFNFLSRIKSLDSLSECIHIHME